MTAATLTLTDFLLARIAEDEEAAKEVRPREYLTSRDYSELGKADSGGYDTVTITSGRVLAECEAKRRIVERCSAVGALMPSEHLAQGVLHLLALPYADHPDYQPEWSA